MLRFLILTLLFGLAACGEGQTGQYTDSGAVYLIDDAGRTLQLTAPPTRVISLVPSATDLIVALGARDRLIARTDFDQDPELSALPSVGPGLTPSVEWLLSLNPDLVIAWSDGADRGLTAQLTELGVPVYNARIESIDDIASTSSRLGALLGRSEAADSLNLAIEGELTEVRRIAEDHPRPRVLYLIGTDPPMTVGNGTFIAEAIELAGGKNLFDDLDGWPLMSIEEALYRQPEIVIVPQGEGNTTPESLSRIPGWREFSAIRDGRAYPVDAQYMHRPGPEIGRITRRIAELLHPDAFPGPHPAPDSP